MLRSVICALWLTLFAMVTAAALSAQSAAPVAFEIASVKRHVDPQFIGFSIRPGGQLAITGMPLASIIQQAFAVRQVQVSGMPEWARTGRFDVTAKAAEGAAVGTQPVLRMLQSLLRTRFNLQAHVETRELPIYVMTLARADGRLGPQLHPSDIDCGGFVPPFSKHSFRNEFMHRFKKDLTRFSRSPRRYRILTADMLRDRRR